jgi:hypothetical protein
MSGLEPDIADHPSTARCLLDAVLIVVGAVLLAVVLYFLVVMAAIVLGVVAFGVLGRITSRMML